MGIQVVIDNPGQGEWVYAGEQEVAADPGSGQWKVNAAGTRIDISVISQTGLSVDSILTQFESGAQVYMRVAGEDRLYTVSDAANNGTWHELTVSVASSSTSFALTDGDVHSIELRLPKGVSGGSGVTDHGALTGLSDDDHTQYFNLARGDARYYTQAEVDAAVNGRAPSAHTHTEDQVTDLDKYTQAEVDAQIATRAPTVHTHVEAQITDLDKYTQAEVDARLATKADTTHAHTESEITDLGDYPDATGQPSGLTPETTGIGGYTFEAKADAVHTHTEDQVTDLDKYTQAEVDAAIATRAPTVHTHTESQITDLGSYPDSTGQPSTKVPQTDGAGGWTFEDPTANLEGDTLRSTGQPGAYTLQTDGTGGTQWAAPGAVETHSLGGPSHDNFASIAQLNSKIDGGSVDQAGTPRPPLSHAANHANGGSDELNVSGLSGLLADPQTPTQHSLGSATQHSPTQLALLNALITDANLDDENAPRDPNPHTHVAANISDLGAAALLDWGDGIGDLPRLQDVNGEASLPAVDGSQLVRTGVRGGSGMGNWTFAGGTIGAVSQGEFRANAFTPQTVSQIVIHEDAISNNSAGSSVWRNLKTGDRLFFTCPSTASYTGPLNVDHTYVLITDADASAAPTITLTVGYEGGGVNAFDSTLPYSITLLYSRSAGSGDGTLAFQDEGTPVVSSDTLNVVGAGATLANVGGVATLTIAPGQAPIDTVFGRTGTVVAEPGDYSASQIDNDSAVAGVFVDDALNTLNLEVATKLDVASPVLPTPGEKAALTGSAGIPGGANVYVTETDSRLTDSRAPTAHEHTLPELGDTYAQSVIVGRAAAGLGALSPLAPTTIRSILNVADGATAAGSTGDAHASSDGSDHSIVVQNQTDISNIQTQLANVPTTIISATDPGPASFGTLWIQTT